MALLMIQSSFFSCKPASSWSFAMLIPSLRYRFYGEKKSSRLDVLGEESCLYLKLRRLGFLFIFFHLLCLCEAAFLPRFCLLHGFACSFYLFSFPCQQRVICFPDCLCRRQRDRISLGGSTNKSTTQRLLWLLWRWKHSISKCVHLPSVFCF